MSAFVATRVGARFSTHPGALASRTHLHTSTNNKEGFITPRAARYLTRSTRAAAAVAKPPTARQVLYEARAARRNAIQDTVVGAQARKETVDEKHDPRRLYTFASVEKETKDKKPNPCRLKVFPGVEEDVQRHEAAAEATRIKQEE